MSIDISEVMISQFILTIAIFTFFLARYKFRVCVNFWTILK